MKKALEGLSYVVPEIHQQIALVHYAFMLWDALHLPIDFDFDFPTSFPCTELSLIYFNFSIYQNRL